MGKDSFNVGATDKLLQRLILICCCVLMFSEVAGVSSVKKCAIIGQATKLFNIDNDYAEPALYSKTKTLIASWKGTTNTVAHMNPRYSGKIYMDKERNIWIFDVERKDSGRYYVKFGAKLEQHEVDIILTVKGTHDSIIGLLKTIMILVISIFVILTIIIVLIYKKLCSEPKQSSQSHEYAAIPTEGSELTEHQVKNWLAGHPEFVKNYKTISSVQRPLKTVEMLLPRSNTLLNGKDEQKANRKSKKSTARILKSLDSESNDECNKLFPKGACGSKLPINDKTISSVQRPLKTVEMLLPRSNTLLNGKDEQKANRKSKKSTARILKSLDSESNDECNELFPKGACGSKLPINEIEDYFHPIVQRTEKIHIRKTEG